MRRVDEIVAALVFDEAARRESKTFKGPKSLLKSEALEGWHNEDFFNSFEIAINFWREQNLLRVHSHLGVEEYIFLDGASLAPKVLFTLDADQILNPDSYQLKYPILSSYFELGSGWLRDIAHAYRRDPDQEAPTPLPNQRIRVESKTWTGRSVGEREVRQIAVLLTKIEVEIDGSSLTNEEKADAKALIEAGRSIIDAPNPQWNLLLQILGSPVLANVASLIALIISIVNAS